MSGPSSEHLFNSAAAVIMTELLDACLEIRHLLTLQACAEGHLAGQEVRAKVASMKLSIKLIIANIEKDLDFH